MMKKQSGAVLVVSLIILFSLMLLVLSSTQSTLIQEKMTSAIREGHVSLEVAESGIMDAERMIEGLTDASGFINANGVINTFGRYSEGDGPTDIFADATWDMGAISIATVEVDDNVFSNYFVEYLGTMTLDPAPELNQGNHNDVVEVEGDMHGFKIVSRSVGRDGNTERVIVSYYGKVF